MRPVIRRPGTTALPLLCALTYAAAAPATITVGVLSNGRNTFWLSGPATQVCYSIPPEANPPTKALLYATTGGRVEYTQGLPPEPSGCVGLAIPLNASMSIEPHTLNVVGAGSAAPVASTAAFNVSAARMVPSHRTNPNNVSITVIAYFSNKAERRLTDVMRVVGRDEVVAGECLCYPTGFISPTQSQAKCTFDILRKPGVATRGPYTMRFYSDRNPQAVAVVSPTPTQTATWASLGL